MFRINDEVKIKVGPGVFAFGLIVAIASLQGVDEFKVKVKDMPEDDNIRTAFANDLTLERSATPNVLEGASIVSEGGGVIAGTVSRVNANGTTIDIRKDKVATVEGPEFDSPETHLYTPDPNGEKFTARLRNDGFWYVEGSKTKVRLGVRETVKVVPAALAA